MLSIAILIDRPKSASLLLNRQIDGAAFQFTFPKKSTAPCFKIGNCNEIGHFNVKQYWA